MKKTRFLALALVVAIALMGAGYAWWSQTLVMSGFVKTGELNVHFVEWVETDGEEYYQVENNAYPLPVGIDNEMHKMDVRYANAHPGAKSQLNFALENKGTIGAWVDNFRITKSQETVAGTAITNLILCDKITIAGVEQEDYEGYYLQDALNYLNGLGNDQGIFLDQMKGNKAENQVAQFGHPSFKQLVLSLVFDGNANESNLPEKNTNGFTFEITADVLQYNQGALPTAITPPAN